MHDHSVDHCPFHNRNENIDLSIACSFGLNICPVSPRRNVLHGQDIESITYQYENTLQLRTFAYVTNTKTYFECCLMAASPIITISTFPSVFVV